MHFGTNIQQYHLVEWAKRGRHDCTESVTFHKLLFISRNTVSETSESNQAAGKEVIKYFPYSGKSELLGFSVSQARLN